MQRYHTCFQTAAKIIDSSGLLLTDNLKRQKDVQKRLKIDCTTYLSQMCSLSNVIYC